MDHSKPEFNEAAAVLTHIALDVKDVEASAAFYAEWCDMEVIHTHNSETGGQPVIWLASPDDSNFEIVLLSSDQDDTGPKREGMRHLGFDVADLETLKYKAEQAEAAGLIHWELQTMKWPVGTLFSIKDPDGNIVEFSTGQPRALDFKAKSQKRQP